MNYKKNQNINYLTIDRNHKWYHLKNKKTRYFKQIFIQSVQDLKQNEYKSNSKDITKHHTKTEQK